MTGPAEIAPSILSAGHARLGVQVPARVTALHHAAARTATSRAAAARGG